MGSTPLDLALQVLLAHAKDPDQALVEDPHAWRDRAEPQDFGYLVAESVPDLDDVELLGPRRLYERQSRKQEYADLVERLKAERKSRLEEFPELSAEIVKAVG